MQRSPRSPCQPSPSAPNPPVISKYNVSRWKPDFKRLKHDPGDHPDGFIFRSRIQAIDQPLIAIDTISGNNACLAATRKQWDTIIKEAKANDKVPEKLKDAQFHRLGYVDKKTNPKKDSDPYNFVRLQHEAPTKLDMEDFPIPLEDFSAERRRKLIEDLNSPAGQKKIRRYRDLMTLGLDKSEARSISNSSTPGYHGYSPYGIGMRTQELSGSPIRRTPQVSYRH